MTQGFVQVAPDSTGKQIDNDTVVLPVGTVILNSDGSTTTLSAPAYYFRQRTVTADPNDVQGLAAVVNGLTGPSGEDYALAVRLPANQPDMVSMLAILSDIDTVLNQMMGRGFMGASSGVLTPDAAPRIRGLPPPVLSPDMALPFVADRYGRQIILPIAGRDASDSNSVTITSATETAIQAADTENYNDLVAIIVTNTSATAVRVDVRDQFSTVTSPPSQFGVMPIYVPAGDMRGISFGSVIAYQTNPNQAWTATVSSAVTDIRIWALFAQNRTR